MERRPASHPAPARGVFFEHARGIQCRDSRARRCPGSVRGVRGGCPRRPGRRRGLSPANWVMPAVPGFGTAGIRAAAARRRGECRPSLGECAQRAFFLTGWTFPGAERPRAGKGGPGGKGLWGSPRSGNERAAPFSLPVNLPFPRLVFGASRRSREGRRAGACGTAARGALSVLAPSGAVLAGP
jgi:hypothetical protein